MTSQFVEWTFRLAIGLPLVVLVSWLLMDED